MDITRQKSTILVIGIASIILGLSTAARNHDLLYPAFISFILIISLNVLTKKAVGHYFETKVWINFWSMYQFGFRKRAHFKTPLFMAWLPLILAFFTKGFFLWLAILEFDVKPKTERVARRHGLYRFTQVTEWHMGLIAAWSVVVTLIAGSIGYILGFELFSKLAVYFAFWQIIPFSSLDGSKIFFSNRTLWMVIAFITTIFFGWALIL